MRKMRILQIYKKEKHTNAERLSTILSEEGILVRPRGIRRLVKRFKATSQIQNRASNWGAKSKLDDNIRSYIDQVCYKISYQIFIYIQWNLLNPEKYLLHVSLNWAFLPCRVLGGSTI